MSGITCALLGSSGLEAQASDSSLQAPVPSSISSDEPSVMTAPSSPEARWIAPGVLPPVSYPETASRFGAADLVLTGVGAATALTAALLGPNENSGRRGGIWFDEAVRDAILPQSFHTQLWARDASDVLLGFSLSFSFLGDALIHTAWLRRSPDVGGQIALLNAEVLAVTLGVQQLTAQQMSRERPYARNCGTGELDENAVQCVARDRYLSHFSGHASVTFALASATCVHHVSLQLSGERPWIPCLFGYLTATATAGLRVLGDQHYATDVLMGALVGSSIGFLIPTLHYSGLGLAPREGGGLSQVFIVPSPQGISVSGVF